MAELPERLRPNSEEVIAKVIDGEAILIRLTTGAYYSLQQVGGAIWSMIEKEWGTDQIAEAIARRWAVAPEQASADVLRIAGELLAESLVVASEAASPEADETTEIAEGERLDYTPPVLEVYSDMGDLLALDPPVPGMEDIPWKE